MTARFAVLVLLALAAPAAAQEVAVPEVPVDVTVRAYKIVAFSQQQTPDWRFVITWTDDQGKMGNDEHFGLNYLPDPANPSGPPLYNPTGADAFLKQLNTMNFTTTSMVKRLLSHLVSHRQDPAVHDLGGAPDVAGG